MYLVPSVREPDRLGNTVYFININTFSSTSKLLTPNMYCWSCKTLVTTYWTQQRSEWYLGNVFLSTENEQQNAVLYGMLSAVTSTYLSFTNDATAMSL